VERPSQRPTPGQAEAFEARFALRVSARLDDGAQTLPHDISERLRIARAQAVSAARATAAVRASQTAPEWAPVTSGLALAGGAPRSGWAQQPGHQRDQHHGRRLEDAPTGWGWRLASALPIVALAIGLWGISQWYQNLQVQAAADVDMALLSDDLPPAAYTDPGFEEFLRTNFSAEGEQPLDGEATHDSDAPAVESLETRDPVES
jgi:Protein of unknown function (DUF3619)